MLSTEALVCVGSKSATWSSLLDKFNEPSRMKALNDIRNKLSTEAILRHSVTCRASDQRDKVYGLLGLLSYGIDIDYRLSVTDIWASFTRALLQSHQDLHDLHYVKTMSVPFWVIDLGAAQQPLNATKNSAPHKHEYSRTEAILDLRFEGMKMMLKGWEIAE